MLNLDRVYDFRFQDVDENKKNLVWLEISEFIYQITNKPKKILDPCAGSCEFLNSLPKSECWGVDIQDQILKSKKNHVKAVIGDIFTTELPLNYFDAIFISNFLEHIDSLDRCVAFIRKMQKLLCKDGRIIIMGPNYKYCYKDYFDCVDHKLVLTHHSVSELLFSEGFSIEQCHDKFLPYSFRSRLPTSAILTRLYLQMPFAWKIFGKQFLIIAKKTN